MVIWLTFGALVHMVLPGPVSEWPILFRTGLLSNLNLAEAHRCRSVCSNWKRPDVCFETW